MASEIIHEAPRKPFRAKMRVHDYLFDPAYIVSDGRDYARQAFKAAMQSAQVTTYPIFSSMFSELKSFPRARHVYYPNCRLPEHVDRSYEGYVRRAALETPVSASQICGKYLIKYNAVPKAVLPLKTSTPDFRPPPPPSLQHLPSKPVNRRVQTMYRESSAQTHPWQPDGVAAAGCDTTPEVMFLDKLQWGPGEPYRIGDLPVDFHTTEIINKTRHARAWYNLVETGKVPGWMKNANGIIVDVEDKDWLFREAEIDELQEIRLMLMHKLQKENRGKQTNKIALKLSRLWESKKEQMERRVSVIRSKRDRQLRKMNASRANQGGFSARALTSQKRVQRHNTILYDPTLLSQIDHEKVSAAPAWLEQCGQELKKSCSGHHLPRNVNTLCERETKWSEKFLEKLHKDLIDARLGATCPGAGPIRILKPRHVDVTPRPATPTAEAVPDAVENTFQCALTMQRVIKGRAVQNLMYEGRCTSAELIGELKSTQGLDGPEKMRILQEDIRARDFYDKQYLDEQRESAISALVQDVCGSAVSKALDFLEKELVRLKEERKQHAFYLVALRDRQMREAAEAGRRQKEERRRNEHDELFKQIVGVTHGTVDEYFREIAKTAVERYAEDSALEHIERRADDTDAQTKEEISSVEQQEMVAELVQHFLLPEAHKQISRNRVTSLQQKRLKAVKEELFGLLDTIENKQILYCEQCRQPFGKCSCQVCPQEKEPEEKLPYKEDPRWKYTRTRPPPPSMEEKIPPYHEFRAMLNDLLDDVVVEARRRRGDVCEMRHFFKEKLKERLEVTLDMRAFATKLVDSATGTLDPPVKEMDYHYTMKRDYRDVLDKPIPKKICGCPKDMPWESHERPKKTCRCKDICMCEKIAEKQALKEMGIKKSKLTEEQLKSLEALKKCKCDTGEYYEGEGEMQSSEKPAELHQRKVVDKCRCKGVCKCEAGKRTGSAKRPKEEVKPPKIKKEQKCIDESELAAKPCLCDLVCRCDAGADDKKKKGQK